MYKFQANPVPKNPGILQNPVPEIPGLKILDPAGACLLHLAGSSGGIRICTVLPKFRCLADRPVQVLRFAYFFTFN